MSIRGGYKIIDLKNTVIYPNGDVVKIEGIYDSIEASYGKPLLLSGLNIGETEYADRFVIPTLNRTTFEFDTLERNYGNVVKLRVHDNDTVDILV